MPLDTSCTLPLNFLSSYEKSVAFSSFLKLKMKFKKPLNFRKDQVAYLPKTTK